jgi:hypothetical protein
MVQKDRESRTAKCHIFSEASKPILMVKNLQVVDQTPATLMGTSISCTSVAEQGVFVKSIRKAPDYTVESMAAWSRFLSTSIEAFVFPYR